MSDDRLKLYRGTVEYLVVKVTADVELDDQAVEITFDRSDPEGWIAAGWIGDPGKTRRARATVNDDNLPVGKHGVYVRVTDTSEAPIVYAGGVHVV